uniref:Dihydrofolate reductase n=1 Tax=Phallusia mammillata TaxID=59560 RepID=A0A6F9DNA0_9ASCI|nr:dihydrofolate reductase-like [Phallusia mammillata]
MKNIEIHSLAACCNNWGIGVNGSLPWRLRKEMAWFTKASIGSPPEGKKNAVVVGRKNWDSIPKSFKPMKNRYNIVMSRTLPLNTPGADAVVRSFEDLIQLLSCEQWQNKIHEVINIGGADIYKVVQESPYCGKVYLTRVMADFKCDTFFPKLDETFTLLPTDQFDNVPQGVHEENGIKWKVEVYQKNKPS